MMSKPGTHQRGLTLLEMMVVLMIAGMAIALGFQSLGQWRRANNAISQISGAVQQTTLTESWIKSSLRSLIPVKEHPFEGDAGRINGIAIQPVLSHQGGATPVRLELTREGSGWELLLQEEQKQIALPLVDIAQASFLYLDADGKTYSQWPPKLGQHDQLPAAIALQLTRQDGRVILWNVAIAGAKNPAFNPFEADLD